MSQFNSKKQMRRAASRKPRSADVVQIAWATPEMLGITFSEEQVATHEAGHLAAALLLQLPLKREAATIVPRDGMRGSVYLESLSLGQANDVDRVGLENFVLFYLGGRAAEELAKGRSFSDYSLTLADGDLSAARKVEEILMPHLPDWYWDTGELAKSYHRLLMARARSLIMNNWAAVQSLKKALLARKTLSRATAKTIFMRSQMKSKRPSKLRSSDLPRVQELIG